MHVQIRKRGHASRLQCASVTKARTVAAAGSAVFFALAPGIVAGVIPWWLTEWRILSPLPFWLPFRIVGALLVLAATAVIVPAFVRFVTEGIGTPAPVAPTEHLVVGGPYRFVRNPMYLAVVTAIVGQALFLGQMGLLLYALAVAVLMVAFVRFYEEPYLSGRFGIEYEEYRRAVPGWWPRWPRPTRR